MIVVITQLFSYCYAMLFQILIGGCVFCHLGVSAPGNQNTDVLSYDHLVIPSSYVVV